MDSRKDNLIEQAGLLQASIESHQRIAAQEAAQLKQLRRKIAESKLDSGNSSSTLADSQDVETSSDEDEDAQKSSHAGGQMRQHLDLEPRTGDQPHNDDRKQHSPESASTTIAQLQAEKEDNEKTILELKKENQAFSLQLSMEKSKSQGYERRIDSLVDQLGYTQAELRKHKKSESNRRFWNRLGWLGLIVGLALIATGALSIAGVIAIGAACTALSLGAGGGVTVGIAAVRAVESCAGNSDPSIEDSDRPARPGPGLSQIQKSLPHSTSQQLSEAKESKRGEVTSAKFIPRSCSDGELGNLSKFKKKPKKQPEALVVSASPKAAGRI